MHITKNIGEKHSKKKGNKRNYNSKNNYEDNFLIKKI